MHVVMWSDFGRPWETMVILGGPPWGGVRCQVSHPGAVSGVRCHDHDHGVVMTILGGGHGFMGSCEVISGSCECM